MKHKDIGRSNTISLNSNLYLKLCIKETRQIRKSFGFPRHYWLKGPRPVSQEGHSFPAQHQTQVLVPLTSQLCRVSDSLSQLTPDTSHPTAVRPDLQHWPESQG